MLPRKILKNNLFNAISCILVWVFMHGASEVHGANEKKILRLVKKLEQEECPTLK